MKKLSLKSNGGVLKETEEVVTEVKVSSERYLNQALMPNNQSSKRRILKQKLAKEIKLIRQTSAAVLAEFEKFAD